MPFSELDIPDQTGKVALITGATGGLGYEMARMLAGAGATVILSGRNEAKGAQALERVRDVWPKADVRFARLDLASLASVQAFCDGAGDEPIDILINNAGLMAPPTRRITSDGFEVQFGTNHLGHFALTGRLIPRLGKAAAPRVVTISSLVAAFGKMDFDNLQSEKSYGPQPAYMRSKLANLLFMRELQNRSDRHGWNITSLAAHPGYSRTDLIENGAGPPRGLMALQVKIVTAIASQDAASGALPAIMAATVPEVEKRGYFGPARFMGVKGPPTQVKLPSKALDDAAALRLWEVSERLTGVRFAP